MAALEIVGRLADDPYYNTRVVKKINQVINEELDPFLRHASIMSVGHIMRDGKGGLLYSKTIEGIEAIYLKLLDDEFYQTRQFVFSRLRLWCYPALSGAALKALKDSFPTVRAEAARQLSFGKAIFKVDHDSIQDVLKQSAENDFSRFVRQRAEGAYNQNNRFLEGKESPQDKLNRQGCEE